MQKLSLFYFLNIKKVFIYSFCVDGVGYVHGLEAIKHKKDVIKRCAINKQRANKLPFQKIIVLMVHHIVLIAS